MSVSSMTYERKHTGDKWQRECCPADGIATASAGFSPNECLQRLLPTTKKVRVTFTDGVYTVPDIMVNQVRGISHGNMNQLYDINLLLINDEGPDVLMLVPGEIHRLHVLSVYEANTTATDIYIHF